MSIRRICQLAGLKESIADDPQLNVSIEDRLNKTLQPKYHPFVLDILEAIKDAGQQGIEVNDIAVHLFKVNAADSFARGLLAGGVMQRLADYVAKDELLSQLVHHEDGRLYWDEHDEQADDVYSMVLKIMRELTSTQGSFTEQDLIQRYAKRANLPVNVARDPVTHVLEKLKSKLVYRNGEYLFKPDEFKSAEEPLSREGNLQFLRDLEAQARKDTRGKPSGKIDQNSKEWQQGYEDGFDGYRMRLPKNASYQDGWFRGDSERDDRRP